jgi:hypothetical protein
MKRKTESYPVVEERKKVMYMWWHCGEYVKVNLKNKTISGELLQEGELFQVWIFQSHQLLVFSYKEDLKERWKSSWTFYAHVLHHVSSMCWMSVTHKIWFVAFRAGQCRVIRITGVPLIWRIKSIWFSIVHKLALSD